MYVHVIDMCMDVGIEGRCVYVCVSMSEPLTGALNYIFTLTGQMYICTVV